MFACVVQGKFGPVHGDLPGRSGAIQAAIHLELPSAEISHVNVLIGKLKIYVTVFGKNNRLARNSIIAYTRK